MSKKKQKKGAKQADNLYQIVGRNNLNISTKPPKHRPKKARIYELDLSVDISSLSAKKIGVKFSKYWKIRNVTDEKILKQEIKKILSAPPAKNQSQLGELDQAAGTQPTNVSLKFKDCHFLVIKLSDDWNWQFSSDGPAFAISAPSGSDEAELAYEVFRQVGGYNSKIAYMVVDGKYAWNDDSRPDDQKEYGCRYNIYVELEDPVTGATLPIIIDPDVRWPDGLD